MPSSEQKQSGNLQMVVSQGGALLGSVSISRLRKKKKKLLTFCYKYSIFHGLEKNFIVVKSGNFLFESFSRGFILLEIVVNSHK